MGELLHEILERGGIGLSGDTSGGGTIERWCQRREQGCFDGGGRDEGRESSYTTPYCRVPNTGLARDTSGSGNVERWRQKRERGRFDGGGRDEGRELSYATLYCRVPNTPYGLLRIRSLWRLDCNLSRRID